MAFTFVATPGASNANSYLTVAEYADYIQTAFEPTEASNALDDPQNLVMATRTLNALLSGHRRLVVGTEYPYYIVSPAWTGAPATTTQSLPWPRIGMYDTNGNAIAEDVIPLDLKNATAELARLLKSGDRTVDNDVTTQGITAVKAGSVEVKFRDSAGELGQRIASNVVWIMMPSSWFTAEYIDYTIATAQLDVFS